MKLIQSAAAIALTLGCALPAQATSTPIYHTTCTWRGSDGATDTQACKVYMNSGGWGTFFKIRWQDGVKTEFGQNRNQKYLQTSTNRLVKLSYKEHGIRFIPSNIRLEGLGNIEIDHANYTTSTDYENF